MIGKSVRGLVFLLCSLTGAQLFGDYDVFYDSPVYEDANLDGMKFSINWDRVTANIRSVSSDITCAVIPEVVAIPCRVGEHYNDQGQLRDYIVRTNECRVTGFDWHAFSYHSNLIKVTLPNGITDIDYEAFIGCNSLQNITIPNSVKRIRDRAFSSCSSLTGVILPNSLEEIEYEVFSGCEALANITIPNSVTYIGGSAFTNCSSLISVTIPNSVRGIGRAAFCECTSLRNVSLSGNLFRIPYSCFENCVSLKTVTIDNGVRIIEGRAFSGCSSLTSLQIPNSVERVGYNAFTGTGIRKTREGLRVVDGWLVGSSDAIPLQGEYRIPDGMKGIGDAVFAGFTGLRSVIIPDSVRHIGVSAFEDCRSLDSVTIPDSVLSIKDYTFFCCSSLLSVKIPSGCTIIGDGAFAGCKNLTSVQIPENVTIIGCSAFEDSGITFIITPNSVKYIGEEAFSRCGNLELVTIGNGLVNATCEIFNRCGNLKKIIFKGAPLQLYYGWYYDDLLLELVSEDELERMPDEDLMGVFFYPYWDNEDHCHYADYVEDIVGYYPAKYRNEWKAVLDSDGKYCGLLMKPSGCQVTFDSNGGSGDMDMQDFEYDEMKALIKNAFKRTGYVFKGWARSPTGEVVYADGEVVVNPGTDDDDEITLYAKWGISKPRISTVNSKSVNDGEDGVIVDDNLDFKIMITCAVKDATIYYALDGAIPKATDLYRYINPIPVHKSVSVRAFAAYEGEESEHTIVSISKTTVKHVVELAGNTSVALVTRKNKNFFPVTDTPQAFNKDCARSGAIEDGDSCWLEARMTGAGTVLFWWMVSCERDPSGGCACDRFSYSVDGVERECIDGETGWCRRSVSFDTDGPHTIRWTYQKDEAGSGGEDCGWVDKITWTRREPSAIIAIDEIGKEIKIQNKWFEDWQERLTNLFGSSDWSEIVQMFTGKTDAGGKALTVLDDYIAGTDPTKEDDMFKAIITIGANGKPVITWYPALNDDATHKGVKDGVRRYKVFGNTGLSADGWMEVEQDASGDWRQVDTGEIVAPRFFKVSVGMP